MLEWITISKLLMNNQDKLSPSNYKLYFPCRRDELHASLFILGAEGSIKTDVSNNKTNLGLKRQSIIIVMP